jgi:signal transduction histidine kinase
VNGEVARVAIREEEDVVYARQRARLIAELAGFSQADQTRIGTAVSEIARNAFKYAGGGEVRFDFDGETPGQQLAVTVRDDGPGIAGLDAVLNGTYRSSTGLGLGIVGTRRLMDTFAVESTPDRGTTVSFAKRLPRGAPPVTEAQLGRFAIELAKWRPTSPLEEIGRQNQELFAAMDELSLRSEELIRVNAELEETNRGVVALYAELEGKARELELTNSELESFAYSVSHDLRAPLRAIDGFVEILYEDNVEHLDADSVATIERVRAAAQRMAALIDDLLTLSRLSRVELVHRRVDMSALAREVTDELLPLEGSRDIEVVIREGLACSGDQVLLRTVLLNLIANALKFTSKHAVAHIEVGGDSDGRRRSFWVRDDGAGFDPTAARSLFGAFRRLHAEADFPGTGIGLATVQRIIRRHHGEVWAEGAVEQGATIFFWVPEAFMDVD